MEEISLRIKQLVDTFTDGNNSKFAAQIGTSEANIRNYINGRQPKFETIQKILERYEISYEWLISGIGTMQGNNVLAEPESVYLSKTEKVTNEQKIPLYNIEAHAGIIPVMQDTSNELIEDYLVIPRVPKCDGAIHITGDSMYPLLKSGDIVAYKIINDFNSEIFWGEMYLVSINVAGDEYISVKYVQKSERGIEWIRLVSENRHHQDKDVQLSKVRSMALVKASVRINSMG